MTEKVMQYIVLGPRAWGRGSSERIAFFNAMRSLSTMYVADDKGQVPLICFEATEETYVNEMGGFNRPQDDPEPVEVWRKKVPQKALEAAKDAFEEAFDGLDTETVYADS